MSTKYQPRTPKVAETPPRKWELDRVDFSIEARARLTPSRKQNGARR